MCLAERRPSAADTTTRSRAFFSNDFDREEVTLFSLAFFSYFTYVVLIGLR